MTTTVLSPTDFATELERHYRDASDDARLVTVGLQDEMRQAEIYSRYAHLYTQDQLDALARARETATDERERTVLTRLWFEAADALAAADIVQEAQDLTNERLAYRVQWDGEDISLNTVGALIAAEPDYDRRDALFTLLCAADEHFAPRDLDLATRSQELRSAIFGLDGEIGIAAARMGIDVEGFAAQIRAVSDATAEHYGTTSALRFTELLGRDVDHPSRAHAAHMRSLHQYDHLFTQERMVEVCNTTLAELGFDLNTIPTILPDVEDRPQKDPRACVIPVRVPQEVYLIVRPTGGITDYQAYLHEAGHALHFGLTAEDLPFSLRALSPDNALTEIYSYVVERITHQPAWYTRHFDLSREQAEEICASVRFVDASLFRRYVAKLQYELSFWRDPRDPRNPSKYAMLLSNATQMRYPTSQFVSDMDPGLYAADYLRAWRSSEELIANLRSELGDEWFATATAGARLRELLVQGTEPANRTYSPRSAAHPPTTER